MNRHKNAEETKRQRDTPSNDVVAPKGTCLIMVSAVCMCCVRDYNVEIKRFVGEPRKCRQERVVQKQCANRAYRALQKSIVRIHYVFVRISSYIPAVYSGGKAKMYSKM